MKKVLISGFGPFLDIKNNPSEALVKSLAEEFNLPYIILPVVFGDAFEVLKAKCREENPDIIIMFGVAATRSKISFERVGLNWVESTNIKIDSNQELALMSSFNLEKIISQYDLNQRKQIEISYSAGTYVCNDLYFRMLNEKNISAEKLFIHIPPFERIQQQELIGLISPIVKNCLNTV